jgi:hypothetical protein
MTDLERWELASWCWDELVGYGCPFDYAYGCTIPLNFPTAEDAEVVAAAWDVSVQRA